MSLLFLASLCLLVSARPCAGQGGDLPPFEVKVIEENGDRKLECASLADFTVEKGKFFRNGVQENTTDVCLPASEDGFLPFNNTPECDGHYSCGTSDTDGFILSGPTTVLGDPKTVTTEAQTLLVCLHCTITIPSNLYVSALDAQEVVWFRIRSGQNDKEKVENAQIMDDYSLTLTRVEKSDVATYFAMATNADGKSVNSPQVDLTVIEKPGIVDVSVFFGDDSVQLTVTANGDDLTYKWMVNDDLRINENSNTFTIPALSSVKMKISVNVSNAIGFDFRTTFIQISSQKTDVSQPTITTSADLEEIGQTDQNCIDHMVVYVEGGACLVILAILVAVILLFACAFFYMLRSNKHPRKQKMRCRVGSNGLEVELDAAEPNDEKDSLDSELKQPSRSASEKDIKTIEDHDHQRSKDNLHLDTTQCESYFT